MFKLNLQFTYEKKRHQIGNHNTSRRISWLLYERMIAHSRVFYTLFLRWAMPVWLSSYIFSCIDGSVLYFTCSIKFFVIQRMQIKGRLYKWMLGRRAHYDYIFNYWKCSLNQKFFVTTFWNIQIAVIIKYTNLIKINLFWRDIMPSLELMDCESR